MPGHEETDVAEPNIGFGRSEQMAFLPIERMWERTEIARQDSDALMFLSLMCTGEVVTKTIVAGLVAGVKDDRERHRYRLLHGLVRANSLGEWPRTLNEMLTGTSSQHLYPAAREEQQELTRKCGDGSWQYEANRLLLECMSTLDEECEALPKKTDCRNWFSLFVKLRNRTRGHGAIKGGDCSRMCRRLEESIRLIAANHALFKRPWVYLHRSLSGRYRVTRLSHDSKPFDYLKSSTEGDFRDGIYVHFDEPRFVDLISSDPDATDFFFANGNFNNKKFELISYITDDISYGDPGPYLQPPTELPESETQGFQGLDLRGKVFTNLPSIPGGYVSRPGLEKELEEVLLDDRRPVVTLVGRGGIGKTWLSLHLLDRIAETGRFYCILWFSARDMDLLPEGPKLVKPHVLTPQDIASEFVNLVGPKRANSDPVEKVTSLQHYLSKSEIGPILFVFDNFETVQNPGDLYTWLDTYIRLPNKILITTRVRDSKGDYPVEVRGMTDKEFEELVVSSARELGIESSITCEHTKQLYEESAGHPYVAKILLGELASNPKSKNVRRIVARRSDILDALFERTYSALSPVAKRVFLTLCRWRSAVAQLALEAVLLRPEHEERMDVEGAIDELKHSSFIEVSTEKDAPFISVPLVAFQFGKGKLEVSPLRASIETDTELLQLFGTIQPADTRHGIEPRIQRVFDQVARKVSRNRQELEDYLPVLEFIARGHPPAWLSLASLHEELNDLDKAKQAITSFLEMSPAEAQRTRAWDRLANLCQKARDWSGEIHARIEMSKLPSTLFYVVSNTANRVNELFRQEHQLFDTEEKRIIVQDLVETMEKRVNEADANDFSRLAWLCLHLKNEEKAGYFTQRGLEEDPDNIYCRRLLAKLRRSYSLT
jgi:tetratricopeptide (TPR) repeat protein